MIKVGLTGGIGSGKSTIAKVFAAMGVPVFNADHEAKLAYYQSDVQAKVKELLGDDTFVNNTPQFSIIASHVFNDREKLNRLNSIIHPAVKHAFEQFILQNKDKKVVIKEAAILFEAGTYKDLDQSILVTAPEDLRIERVMKRDGVNRSQVLSRMKNQWTDHDKMKMADDVIKNDERELVIPQVLNIYKKLIHFEDIKG